MYVFYVSPFLFNFIIIITAQGCLRSNMFVHFLKILDLFLNKGLEMNAFFVFYPIRRLIEKIIDRLIDYYNNR